MKVLILGGDGYLGWPTAMDLSARGHEVTVTDNYLRRKMCLEEDVAPLYPVPTLPERVKLWQELSGHEIRQWVGDLREWEFISTLMASSQPECVVHYAEQPSAPYSMLNRRAAMLTLQNNLTVTANAIFAVREFCPQAHIVKLGTMGEYGTPNIDIEEGWLEIEHKGRRDRFLYPRAAGSLYHTTKIQDTDLLWFYVRTWGLRVTDLMQGPVYGVYTPQSRQDDRLLPFLNYDELFGTVLNRFVVQAAAGYPLTVYGKGGQTRGYLNLLDTLQCVRLALETPPSAGELRVMNQFTETFSVRELAERVTRAASALDLKVEIRSVANPRLEAEEHYYNPAHTAFDALGLRPHLLTDEVLSEMLALVLSRRENIDPSRFMGKGARW